MANELTTTAKAPVKMENGVLKPDTFEGAWRVACIYAESGMVPKQYIGNPAAIMVAGQFGAELGLSLMASLQNIAVINGNPSLWGDAMLAVVRNSETLEIFVEYETGTFPNDDFAAVCIAKRSGVGQPYNPEDDLATMAKKGIIVSIYTINDAKIAGLWGAAKDNWKKYPKRMLKMRARAYALRDGWPDKLKGMRSIEEMQDATETVEMIKETGNKFRADTAGMVEKDPPVYGESFGYTTDQLIYKFHELTENWPGVIDFIGAVAKSQGMDPDQAKAQIIRENDFDNFKAAYDQWAPKRKGTENGTTDSPDAADLAGSGNHGQEDQPEKKSQESAPDADALSPGQGSSGSDPTVEESINWCKSNDLLGAYREDKRNFVQIAAAALNIDMKGKTPKMVHAEVRSKVIKSNTASVDSPNEELMELSDYFNESLVRAQTEAGVKPLFIQACEAAGIRPGSRPTTTEQGRSFKESFSQLVSPEIKKDAEVADVDPDAILSKMGTFMVINYPTVQIHMFRNFLASRSAGSGVPVHVYAQDVMGGKDEEIVKQFNAWMEERM